MSVGNTAAAVSVVLPSIVIGRIVSRLTAHRAASIRGPILLLAGLLALFVVLKLAIHISLHGVLPRIEATLRQAQLERALTTPVLGATPDNQYAAELNSLMGKGAKAGADSVKIVFADLMPAAMQATVATVAAFATQWLIALVLIASGAVSTAITGFQLRSQGGVRVAINRAKARLDGVTTELLRGKSVIRSLNAAEAESRRVGNRAMELSAVEVRHHKAMGLFDAAKTAAESMFSLIVLILAARFVASGANAGTVLTLYLLFMQFAAPLRDIHRIRDEFNESALQLAEVFQVLAQPVDPLFTRPDSGQTPGEGGAVSVQGVCVAYRERHDVVRSVSLHVPTGSYLGVCGPAGCGKTTLVKAIVGILPLSAGRVAIGSIDTATMSIGQLASAVAYVSQEPYVISGTIRENLLIGQQLALPDESLEAALDLVGLGTELEEQGGLDAATGEDGQGLSGGQRQRLVLARVLLRPAQLIVLDEATSALDNLNEEKFMTALERSQRTVIAVAHRLSTLRKADRIIVMDEGRVLEAGTYESLDESRGLFHSLLHAGERP